MKNNNNNKIINIYGVSAEKNEETYKKLIKSGYFVVVLRKVFYVEPT